MLKGFLSQLFLIGTLLVTHAIANDFSDLVSADDGTFSWRGWSRLPSNPSRDQLNAGARNAYEEMLRDADNRNMNDVPNAMSVAFWPEANGGVLIFASSIRGGDTSVETTNWVNSCNLGGHRYQGMCAEINNIAYAHQQHTLRSPPTFAVYGVKNRATREVGSLQPCGRQGDSRGCDAFFTRVGGICILKRGAEAESIAEPVAKAPEKPKKASSKTHVAKGTKTHSSARGTKTHTTKAIKTDHPSTITGTPRVESGAACQRQTALPKDESMKIDISALASVKPGSSHTKATGASHKKHGAKATPRALSRRHLARFFF